MLHKGLFTIRIMKGYVPAVAGGRCWMCLYVETMRLGYGWCIHDNKRINTDLNKLTIALDCMNIIQELRKWVKSNNIDSTHALTHTSRESLLLSGQTQSKWTQTPYWLFPLKDRNPDEIVLLALVSISDKEKFSFDLWHRSTI